MQQEYVIMIIDDDDDYCFLTKKIIQRTGLGKQIITASQGQEAINKLKELTARGEEMPVLILLDLKMPIMDGFEFLEEATSSPELDLGNTKIFVTTSSALPKDKERAARYPISGFLPKPVNPHILKSLIS